MAKYNVGVYGVGDVAAEYIRAADNNPLSEVTALVGHHKDKTAGRAKELGLDCDVLGSYDELIDSGIQAVVITSPHFLHAEEAIKAARKGIHIVCEKPIGMTWGEICRVRSEVQKAGVQFQNGLALRWNPFVRNLKNMMELGNFGKLFYIEVDYFHGLGPWWNGFTWGVHKKSGGPSASLVGGIHAADILRYLGGNVKTVRAVRTRGHREDFEYAPTYIATAELENGVVGKTSCSYEIESPYFMNFILHGSDCSVINDRYYSRKMFPGQTGWQRFETIMPDSPSVAHHPFRSLMDDFFNAVEGKETNLLNIEETFRSHEFCVAIDRSMETGETVQLPLEGE